MSKTVITRFIKDTLYRVAQKLQHQPTLRLIAASLLTVCCYLSPICVPSINHARILSKANLYWSDSLFRKFLTIYYNLNSFQFIFDILYSSHDPENGISLALHMTEISREKHFFMIQDQLNRRPHWAVGSNHLTRIYINFIMGISLSA